jgi:phage tail-like protein
MAGEDHIRSQANAAFRFVVDVDGERQAAFTECTLPSIELDVEELKEGGLNSYTHQLPGRRKSARITLKNGVGKSNLLGWYIESLVKPVMRKRFTITLLDPQFKPVMVWNIQEAYPVKWSGPNLKSDDNTIAIQSLELVCGEVVVALG